MDEECQALCQKECTFGAHINCLASVYVQRVSCIAVSVYVRRICFIELDVPSLLGETIKAIWQLKNNKATGIDGVSPEAWINEGLELFHVEVYTSILN